jgi:hypothetical protein
VECLITKISQFGVTSSPFKIAPWLAKYFKLTSACFDVLLEPENPLPFALIFMQTYAGNAAAI